MSTTDRNDAAQNVSSDQNVSSVRSTISRRKLAANRRNAKRSTGPRTEAGKRIASRNAVTHAIFCRELLVGEERKDELVALRESIRAALVPIDAIEHGFVDSLVAARWQLRRLRAAGRYLHEQAAGAVQIWGGVRLARLEGGIEDLDGSEARERRRIYEAIRNMEESLDDADGLPRRRRRESHDDDDDRETRRRRYESALHDPLPVGLTIARDLSRGPGSAWERLGRYEQRLEQSIARSMRELRAYRKDLREYGRPEPAEQLEDEHEEKAQNEPTEEESSASDDTAKGCEASVSSMGVPPMPDGAEECMGGTPMLREEDETRENKARDASD